MASIIDSITSAAGGAISAAKSAFNSATDFVEGLLGMSVDKYALFYLGGTVAVSKIDGLGIMAIDLSRTKSVANHPLESLKTLQDNVVFEPATASITFLAEASAVDALYKLLEDSYASNILFTIQIDGRQYENFIISGLPIQRTPEIYDALQVTVSFHEYVQAVANYSAMSDPQNVELAQYADRQKTGLAKPVTVSGSDAIAVKAAMTVPN